VAVQSFEAEILEWLEQRKLPHEFVQGQYLIYLDTLRIQLIPNLSYPDYATLPKRNSLHTVRVWEDIYVQNKDIVKSILMSRLGLNERVYARQTTVKLLSQPDLNLFLNENHLLGDTKSKYRIGLLKDGEVVAAIAFGRVCPIDYQGTTYKSHELIRYCSKKGITVVGGLTKLLTSFVRKSNPEHIMTYVDKEWSDGNNFSKIGFELIGETSPETFWLSLEDGKRYRKHAFEHLEDANKEQWQELENSGNYKFIKRYK
jgi:hypothetical protein